MHNNVLDFIGDVRRLHPQYFHNKKVLDVGSLDINGNNRMHFAFCEYMGIDICEGPNVDILCPIHELEGENEYDVIICTEMLEHDQYYTASLAKMVDLLRPGGLLLLTCAGFGRAEHGTKRTTPENSPATTDYYKNICLSDVLEFDREFKFSEYGISYKNLDFRFYAIKREC